MMAVVICMVAAIAIRSLITNIYLSKIMGVSNEINVIWECVLSLIFIVINLTLPMYIAFFVYLTACRYYRLVDDYVGDKTIVDGMEQNVKAGDVITMSAGCRHTVIAETELKLIEVQLGKEIDVNDKQKFELEY